MSKMTSLIVCLVLAALLPMAAFGASSEHSAIYR